MDDLRIAFLNVQGFAPKKSRLTEFLKREAIHVLCLAETFQPPHRNLNLPGYQVIARPREVWTDRRASGGVAIFAMNELPLDAIPTPDNLKDEEVVAARISLSNGTRLNIITAYIRPGRNTPPALFRFAAATADSILCGDFNARHTELDDHDSNAAGRHFLQLLDDHPSLTRLTLEDPSCHNHNGFSNPDHVILQDTVLPKLRNPAVVLDSTEIGSDHDIIVFDLDYQPPRKGPPRTIRPFGKKAKETFKEKLKSRIALPPPDCVEALESQAADIQLAISTAFSESTSELHLPDSTPAISAAARGLISRARRLRKEIRRRHKLQIPIDPALRTELNYLKARIKRDIITTRSNNWAKAITSLHPSQGAQFWKMVKILAGQSQKSSHLSIQGRTIADSETKAQVFADSLRDIFTDTGGPEFNFHDHYQRAEQAVTQWLRTPGPPEESNHALLQPISRPEILEVLARKTKKSAPGRDGISWSILRECPTNILDELATLYSASIRLRHWPEIFKKGVFIMIPKPGKDPRSPGNYRPICLLPTLSKILEEILRARMFAVVTEQHGIPSTQHGFRPGRSTTTAILRLHAKIACALEEKETASAVFLDINRAFDKISHTLLLYKLRTLHRMPIATIRLLHSFLRDRSCSVRVGSSYSEEFTPDAGTPQGSPLSPLLYNLFSADLPTIPRAFKQEYADDTLYMVAGRHAQATSNHLQRVVLPVLTEWMRRWKVSPNPAKTVLVHFTSRVIGLDQEDRQTGIHFWGENILPSTSALYLGVRFSHTLNWSHHFTATKKKIRQREAVIRIMHGRGFAARPNVALTVYKALLRPLVLYAIPALGELNPTVSRSIIQGERRVLRLAAGLPCVFPSAAIYQHTNCPELPESMEKLSTKFASKLLADLPDFAEELAEGPGPRRRRIRHYRTPTLHLLEAAKRDNPDLVLPPVFRALQRFVR